MAEFATIARPYAKALFDLADDKQQAESWLGGLKELAWIVQQPSVSTLLDDTSDTVEYKVKFLLDLLSDNQAVKNEMFCNFVKVPEKDRKPSFWPIWSGTSIQAWMLLLKFPPN